MSYGNDSTLYKKRIEKITSLNNWLKQRGYAKPGYINGDTSLLSRECDTAINLFFSNEQFNKRYNVKLTILRYSVFLSKMNVQDFYLKMPDQQHDSSIRLPDYPSFYNNTIVFYLRMYNDEFEGMYFEFAKNTDKLIYLIEAGGDKTDYKAKKAFLNSLN